MAGLCWAPLSGPWFSESVVLFLLCSGLFTRIHAELVSYHQKRPGPAPVAARLTTQGANVSTHPDTEPEKSQSDAVGHAHWGEEPDFGWRGALVLDVADDLLRGLPLVHLPFDPLVKAAFLQGAIEANQQLDVAVEAGAGEGGQVAQHVVPLASADPVRVEAAVEPVEAVLGVHEQPQRTLRRSLPVASYHAPAGQLLKLHGHHGAGTVLLDVLLEALNAHVEHPSDGNLKQQQSKSGRSMLKCPWQ